MQLGIESMLGMLPYVSHDQEYYTLHSLRTAMALGTCTRDMFDAAFAGGLSRSRDVMRRFGGVLQGMVG